MYLSQVDFVKISRALATSIETARQEPQYEPALVKLEQAKKELHHALSFCLKTVKK